MTLHYAQAGFKKLTVKPEEWDFNTGRVTWERFFETELKPLAGAHTPTHHQPPLEYYLKMATEFINRKCLDICDFLQTEFQNIPHVLQFCGRLVVA
jgi:hypothetical protein